MHDKGSKQRGSAGRSGDYQIGYARPPQWTRFAPGQSGNPAGRPKRPQDVAALARAALERKVSTIGSRNKSMVRDVAIRNLAHKAAAGDQRALSFLLSLAGEHGPSQKVSSDAFVFDSHDLEIIEEFCKDRQATRGDRNGRK